MNKKLIDAISRYVEHALSDLKGHYYHHFWHALEISSRSVEIAKKEWLDTHSQELLAIAGLFHDIGFSERYERNEPLWALHAKKYLENISYASSDIDTIYHIILATDIDLPAENILHKIIKDADIDNLWREDFWEKWEQLRQEMQYINGINIKQIDWYKTSLSLMSKLTFLTETNLRERQPKKEENTLLLQQKILELS